MIMASLASTLPQQLLPAPLNYLIAPFHCLRCLLLRTTVVAIIVARWVWEWQYQDSDRTPILVHCFACR